MTPRERFLTALRRKMPDRVPVDLGWCGFNREAFRLFREKTGSDNTEVPPENISAMVEAA